MPVPALDVRPVRTEEAKYDDVPASEPVTSLLVPACWKLRARPKVAARRCASLSTSRSSKGRFFFGLGVVLPLVDAMDGARAHASREKYDEVEAVSSSECADEL